jgi:major membrane immunogen (membrane-anchored lipoprotein)
VYNNQSWVGAITVYVGSSTGSITVTTSPSACGESGCANFILSSGTYNVSASATTGESWTGEVTVTTGGCELLELN